MTDGNLQPDRLTLSEENLKSGPASARRPRRSKRVIEAGFEETISLDPSYDRCAPRGYSLMRTRRLLMAALRVWELKNGFHSSY
jgi:hypothetical protein